MPACFPDDPAAARGPDEDVVPIGEPDDGDFADDDYDEDEEDDDEDEEPINVGQGRPSPELDVGARSVL